MVANARQRRPVQPEITKTVIAEMRQLRERLGPDDPAGMGVADGLDEAGNAAEKAGGAVGESKRRHVFCVSFNQGDSGGMPLVRWR